MEPFDKLKIKLSELFQFDQVDLDFGIYRIMNANREEIIRFLEEKLLPQVLEAFQGYKSSDKEEIRQDLEKAINGAEALGMDPETVPKVKELRVRYETEAVDVTALENEVYDHLCIFFSRYYDEGDFISMRRYREGVYAIPYEGEEVKLYWANQDQYYIKTTENFRDYAFKLPDGRRVHFKIVEADTEKDNVKAANGKDRRFFLHGETPVTEESGELVIRFDYYPDTEKRKQDDLNKETVETVLATKGIDPTWANVLSQEWRLSDGKTSGKPILEKHLSDYTRRNTFDYFIHKDLGRFLRRELDFYIKNEIMHLDDVENETALRVEQYLSKIKVIRRVAHKIIDFLTQIEDFQKKLWLKKKFVIETNYCLTLDRIFAIKDQKMQDWLISQIIFNDAQREEWVKLFAIDEIKGDLTMLGYSMPLALDFLKANSFFVLDTKFFSQEFKDKLIASFDYIDERCDGLLAHSENFQALNLFQRRFHQQIKCTYIDPPYNSPSSEILYKNDYKHSAWATLMSDRIATTNGMMNDGVYVIAIDENEQERLGLIIDDSWLATYKKVLVSIRHNPRGIQGKNFSHCNEFAYFIYPSDNKKYIGERMLDEPDVRTLRDSGLESDREDARNCFYPFFVRDGRIVSIGEVVNDGYHPASVNETNMNGEIAIWPIDSTGNEKKWRFARQSVERILEKLLVQEKRGKYDVYYAKDTGTLRTMWTEAQFDASEYGTKLLQDLFGRVDIDFSYPKSLFTLVETIRVTSNKAGNNWILDYFAGSGTTGHAVIYVNREDNGTRRYLLVEMGNYFDTVLKPRIQKVVYAKDWKEGKPVSRNTGISHMFKYIRLESYEDALANLRLRRTPAQQSLLDSSESFRESYMLSYMLDIETKGSPSLLDIDQFDDPFSYQILVGTGSVGETKPVTVDLLETFNWLLGLKVRHIDTFDGFRVVEGTNPQNEKVLVIWRKIRDLAETDPAKIQEQRVKANEALEAFFRKQQYNTMDMEFDVIYTNGDNNLMNLPMAPEGEGREPRYKVRLIEEEFQRLMFDVKDV